MRQRIMAVAAIALTLISCSSGGSSGGYGAGGGYGTGPVADPTPGADQVVATSTRTFDPASLNTLVGHTVTFVFASVGHNVFFDAKVGVPADIPGTNANINVTRVFSTAGTFTFTCHIHPSMNGTVIVQ